jgi:hypothetical protein
MYPEDLEDRRHPEDPEDHPKDPEVLSTQVVLVHQLNP